MTIYARHWNGIKKMDIKEILTIIIRFYIIDSVPNQAKKNVNKKFNKSSCILI